MAERKLTVFIYLPDETIAVPAGVFTHEGDLGIGSFSYGRRYIERKNAIPVDFVALPIGPTPREVTINGGIYGAFRDASPDYWGRLVIAAEAKVPPEALSEIEFLVAANATRAGNLDFRLSPDDPEPGHQPPHFSQLAEIIEAAVKIEMGEEAEDHLLMLLRQGSSMGGARPKCTVEWNDALWIAKFSAKDDTLSIPRIEYATMTLASLCGINVPESHIISIGDNDVFLVRRFDREKKGQEWLRCGFISALSFMQWDEMDRLQWDYAAIADNMRRYMSVDNIQEIFRRMVFNIFVRNTDDHPRNHGFGVCKKELSLSPAYDIVPSLTAKGVGTDFRLAMSVGEKGREATLQNALSRASRFNLSNERAQEIIEQLLEKTGYWKDHFEECNVSGHDIDMLSPSFSHLDGML